MNIEELRDYCLDKKGVTEDFPFDETTLVFKVLGKMFALTDLENNFTVNLKCNPEWAIELREQNSTIIPGFHMNKKHWNTIKIYEGINDSLLKKLIDHSYELVVEKLPAKLRSQL